MPPKSRPYQLLMPDDTGTRKHVGYYATKLDREIAKQRIETSGRLHTRIYKTKRGEYAITVDHLIRGSITQGDGHMIKFKVVADTPDQVIHTMRDAMNIIDHCYPDALLTVDCLPDGVKIIPGSKSTQEWRLYKSGRISRKPETCNKNEYQETIFYRELPERLVEKKTRNSRADFPDWYERYEKAKRKPDFLELNELPDWLNPK